MTVNFLRNVRSKAASGVVKPLVLGLVIGVFVLATAGVFGIRALIAYGKSKENAQLIMKVGKLVPINLKEQPLIATVRDAKMVRERNPYFYQNARQGDRVLIWTDKAVLYSETEDRLLAVMPVNVVRAAAATTSTTPVIEKAKIEVRNGTGKAGYAKAMSDQLKAVGLDVSAIGEAKAKTYQKTIIIKVSAQELPTTLGTLQKATGASVVPAIASEGEVKADFLVIVGADFKK